MDEEQYVERLRAETERADTLGRLLVEQRMRSRAALAAFALFVTLLAGTWTSYLVMSDSGDDVIFTTGATSDFLSLKNLPWGSVAHNVPDEMRYNESRIVEILVSPTHSVDELEGMLSSDARGMSLQIAPMMTATLVGQGFQIEPSTPPVQPVAKDSPTRWQWTIKPKPGAYDVQLLTLSLWARVQMRRQDTDREVRTFNQPIQVKITRLERTVGFMGEHWEWFATPMLGFVGWWGRRRLFPSPSPRSRNEDA